MTTTNEFFNRLGGVWQNKLDGQWQDSFGWNFISQPKLNAPGGSDFEMRSAITTIIESGEMNTESWQEAIHQIDNRISSGFEKSEVLRFVADRLPDNESLKSLYNDAVMNISSSNTRNSLRIL